MSNNFIDLTGQIFGSWKVLRKAESNKYGHTMFEVECICGNINIVSSWDLRKGKTKSCGYIECEAAHNIKSKATSQHGLSKTKEYLIWKNIKSRCLNINNYDYQNYGGRGIIIYEPWINNFQLFYNYLQTLPETREQFEARTGLSGKDVTLDRIDVNGNYEPDNLRWASNTQQMRNQTTTVLNEKIAKVINDNKNTHTSSMLQDLIFEEFGIFINESTVQNVMYNRTWKL
jgi:hypothetical protein